MTREDQRPKLLLILKIYSSSSDTHGDLTVETEIHDSLVFRSFLGIDLIENVPDEMVICRFRHFLEHLHLPQKFFRRTKEILEEIYPEAGNYCWCDHYQSFFSHKKT